MQRHYRTSPRKIRSPVTTSGPQSDIADHGPLTTRSSENDLTVLHNPEGTGRSTQTHRWVAISNPVCKPSFRPLCKACMASLVFLPHFNIFGRRLASLDVLGSLWEKNGNLSLSSGFALSWFSSRPLSPISRSMRSACLIFLRNGRIGWVGSSWTPMPRNRHNRSDPSSQSISKVCHHLFVGLVAQSWNRYGVTLVRRVRLACCSVSFGKPSTQEQATNGRKILSVSKKSFKLFYLSLTCKFYLTCFSSSLADTQQTEIQTSYSAQKWTFIIQTSTPLSIFRIECGNITYNSFHFYFQQWLSILFSRNEYLFDMKRNHVLQYLLFTTTPLTF